VICAAYFWNGAKHTFSEPYANALGQGSDLPVGTITQHPLNLATVLQRSIFQQVQVAQRQETSRDLNASAGLHSFRYIITPRYRVGAQRAKEYLTGKQGGKVGMHCGRMLHWGRVVLMLSVLWLPGVSGEWTGTM